MNSKEREFLEKLDKEYFGRRSKVASWILMGVWIVLLTIACSIPAQDVMLGNNDGDKVFELLPFSIAIASSFAVSASVSPYRTYVEQAKDSLGSVIVLLQYHPVNLMQIQREKVKYQLLFLSKLAVYCLIVQLVSAYIVLKEITWFNFVYVLVFAFVLPAIYEILVSRIKVKYLYGV